MTVAIFGREFNAANSGKLLTLLRSLGKKGVQIIYYSSFLSALPGSLRELIPSGERFDACSDLSHLGETALSCPPLLWCVTAEFLSLE